MDKSPGQQAARPHVTAASIPSPRVVRLLGADARLPANDEPDTRGDLSEADLLEIDREFQRVKAADPFRQAEADRAMRRAPGHWR